MPTKKKTTGKKTTAKSKKVAINSEEKVVKTTSVGKYYYATGKRKTAAAKVRLYKGTGEITVNNKPASEYFCVKTLMGLIKSPLKLTGTLQKYDISAMVTGGGMVAQAEAVRHGISKALLESDPLNRPTLRKAGMLTRDPRSKERKKFGLKRARRAPQFSKR